MGVTMELQGTFENGVVVLDDGAVLADGDRVEVRTLPQPVPAGSTLGERMAWLVGAASSLPADFSSEHDHYIHGTPRRKPLPS